LNIFGELGIFVIFLGEEIGMKNVKSIRAKELFTIKNFVREYLKQEKG